MAIKAVIFDMDGTLVDSEKVSVAAWKRAAEVMNVDLPDDLIRSFIGRNVQSYRAMLIDHLGGDEEFGDTVLQAHLDAYFEIQESIIELKPGAKESLAALREMGLPLALGTSTPREWAEPRMAFFDLQKEFVTTTCGDEVERGKPAPDIFLAAAVSLGIHPEDCAVIEDSHNGVLAGHAAGMQVFMVPDIIPPTEEIRAMCTAVLDTLHELPAAIEAVR